jgi:predicted dehydrogenase
MDILHVGLGMRSRHRLNIVRDHQEANSVGCGTSHAASRERGEKHFPGVPCDEVLEEALQQVAADATIVASQPVQHAAQTIVTLESS